MEAVILDWSGTAIDYGCFAPIKAFMETFREYGVNPTMEEARKPMGMLKQDHLRTMLAMPRIRGCWKEIYGRDYSEVDVHNMYGKFEEKLFGLLAAFSEPKPYVLETVKILRGRNIKIGSTTGYTDAMMKTVAQTAKTNGYEPDLWFTPDSTGHFGRPYPYMIFKNLEALKVSSVKEAMKIGDTISDIREGKNAGVWTVGVIEGSSEMGLTEDEFASLSPEAKTRHSQRVAKAYSDAGADFAVNNLSEIIPLMERIDAMVSK